MKISFSAVPQVLAACLLAMYMSACTLLSTESDQIAAYAGKTVKGYCENVTLPEVRAQIRAKVNAAAAPHSIAVTCAVPHYDNTVPDDEHDIGPMGEDAPVSVP